MRAMRAEGFSGYKDFKLVDLPKPAVSDGKVLLRMTAAGGTPLDHKIRSGHFPPAKAPLVLGNEGAGVVEEGGGTRLCPGSEELIRLREERIEDTSLRSSVEIRRLRSRPDRGKW